VNRGGTSESGGCARSRRGCEQEELDEGELVTINIAGDWSSASGGVEMEKRERAPASGF